MSFEPPVLFFCAGGRGRPAALRPQDAIGMKGGVDLIGKIVAHLRDNYEQNYGLLMITDRVEGHSR